MKSTSIRVFFAGLAFITLALAGQTPVLGAPQDKVKDPVCGMSVDSGTAKYSTTYNEKKYYFCSESCLNKFKADPAKYVKGDERPARAKDPVCGMSVDPATTKYSSEHKGKKYYFCSEDCLNKFKADPAKYAK
jgi:Cu+-exporting ATPase